MWHRLNARPPGRGARQVFQDLNINIPTLTAAENLMLPRAVAIIVGLVLACPWVVGATGRGASRLPLPLLIAVGVVVPLLAALAAGIFTSGRLPMTRRAVG